MVHAGHVQASKYLALYATHLLKPKQVVAAITEAYPNGRMPTNARNKLATAQKNLAIAQADPRYAAALDVSDKYKRNLDRLRAVLNMS